MTLRKKSDVRWTVLCVAGLLVLNGCGGARAKNEGAASSSTPVETATTSPVPTLPALLPWEEGQYVEYLRTNQDGGWAAYKISIQKRISKTQWEIMAVVKTADREMVFGLKVDENGIGEGEFPIDILGYNTIRGEEPDQVQISMNISLLANLFNYRLMYLATRQGDGSFKTSPKQVSYGFGIDEVIRLEDPWPEFDHTKYHEFSTKVPVLGFAAQERSDNASALRVVAFGISQEGGFSAFPAYVDFDHAEPVSWGEFTVTLPASWMLEQIMENEETHMRFHMFLMGGNNHAVNFVVAVEQADEKTFETQCAAAKEELKNAGLPDQDVTYKLLDESTFDTSRSGPAVTYTHKLTGYGQIGRSIATALCDADSYRIARLITSLHYKDDNPLLKSIDACDDKVVAMHKSFVFTEANKDEHAKEEVE